MLGAVTADAKSGGHVKQVNIAICTQIEVPVETPPVPIVPWQYWGIAVPGYSYLCQAFILLGRDVLGDTS